MDLEPGALDLDDPLHEGAFRPEALGPLGHTLTTEPPADGRREVPVELLLDGELAATIADHGQALGGVDPPVAAASWTNHLTTMLVPGPLVAWTLADVGLDVSAANVSLHLDGSRPTACRIRDPTRAWRGPTERDRTLTSLLEGTLEPLFAACEEHHELPRALAWTHVGNIVAYLFDRLAELELCPPGVEDRRRLLAVEQPDWRAGSNPLVDTVTYETVDSQHGPPTYQVRAMCCLKHEIPGKDACVSCPRIDTERRGELLDRRRRQR